MIENRKIEKALPILSTIVGSFLTGEAAIRGDLPSSIANGLALVNSLKNIVNRRMYNFTISLAEKAEELEEQKIINIQDLFNDDKFNSAFIQGLEIARRNHRQEKLDALRNAVLNISIQDKPNEDTQFIILRYIDELSPTHVRILTFLDNPKKWSENNEDDYGYPEKFGMNFEGNNLNVISRRGYPALQGLERFSGDLESRGLIINMNYLRDFKSGEYMSYPWEKCWTSSLGRQFLDYIEKPTKDTA